MAAQNGLPSPVEEVVEVVEVEGLGTVDVVVAGLVVGVASSSPEQAAVARAAATATPTNDRRT